jgi:hypothetical protein
MRDLRKEDGYRPLPDKRYWHSYGLQLLGPSKFTDAVSKIVRGKDLLISTRGRLIDYGNSGFYNSN